jgi:hypothetical protein
VSITPQAENVLAGRINPFRYTDTFLNEHLVSAKTDRPGEQVSRPLPSHREPADRLQPLVKLVIDIQDTHRQSIGTYELL